MSIHTRNQEDRFVLALLYDEHRRTYPETAESIQREDVSDCQTAGRIWLLIL